MALGITGHGGFISQPLAIVVIGGLISSTVLTLIVLPTLYNLVEGAKERRRARKAGGSDAGETPKPDAPVGPGTSGAAVATAQPVLIDASGLPHAPQLTRREMRERGE